MFDDLVNTAFKEYVKSSNVGSFRGKPAAPRCGRRRNSSGGIPPVKCGHLADRPCTIGDIRRIYHALVACISVAPLRIVHKLILSKFVCLIFFNYVKMALGVM